MKQIIKNVLAFLRERQAQKTRKKEVKAMFEMLNNL
jgi:hypothetical protein